MLPLAALGMALALGPSSGSHSFSLGANDFLLDGKPFQMLSGEMHPARIPAEYWRHRLRMAKAMGLNTVAAYVFWNFHESKPGQFDFRTGRHNLPAFLRLAQQEGLWVVLRPGPYVCAEWEFGGIPPYLLRNMDLKVRCTDPHYLNAAKRYIGKLAKVVSPFLVTKGGPILMVQIENEYGSYGNDRSYLHELEGAWRKAGVDVPFYTADGPTPYMLEAGSLPGAAVGLDSGSDESHWDLARRVNPGVPVFSSETYPGWLTHWGEDWAKVGTESIGSEVSWLMEHHKSFNLYVLHGGTNFGFTAGANSGGKGYEPDLTSYDYDAPVDEQGRATEKYLRLREIIGKGRELPPIPDPIPVMGVPAFEMRPFASIWNSLPKATAIVQPVSFEQLGQDYGFVLYRTRLVGHHSGKLRLTELHDYATVFLDGKYVGAIDRRLGESTIDLPESSSAQPVLDILVEAMGRINFADKMIDRKGITERATLNGMTLMNWEAYALPMNDKWVQGIAPTTGTDRPGVFFQGTFELDTVADTFLDVANFTKGVLWVNGHNLGRFWKIGPQQRLFCPAPWLKKGTNVVTIFDLHETKERTIFGATSLR